MNVGKDEPLELSDSLAELQRYLGTAKPASLSTLGDAWDQLIGIRLAEHCRLHSIRHGTLVVEASEPAVAEQLKWMRVDLRDAANAVLGGSEITTVEVRLVR